MNESDHQQTLDLDAPICPECGGQDFEWVEVTDLLEGADPEEIAEFWEVQHFKPGEAERVTHTCRRCGMEREPWDDGGFPTVRQWKTTEVGRMTIRAVRELFPKTGEALQDLRCQVLRQGYILRPISPTVLQAVADVVEGRETAAEIAEHRGIARTAASNRLKAARVLGLLKEEKIVGPRGKKLFSPTPDGLAMVGATLKPVQLTCFDCQHFIIERIDYEPRDIRCLARHFQPHDMTHRDDLAQCMRKAETCPDYCREEA